MQVEVAEAWRRRWPEQVRRVSIDSADWIYVRDPVTQDITSRVLYAWVGAQRGDGTCRAFHCVFRQVAAPSGWGPLEYQGVTGWGFEIAPDLLR